MKRKKVWKRALAAVLTLAMALGVVPMTAFAEETSQAAADAAAMQALESRVFIIGDEENTIEDLEEATLVMVTTREGENLLIPGDEIRASMLANDFIIVDGKIYVSLEYMTHGYARIKIYATSSYELQKLEADNLICRDSIGNRYVQCDLMKTNTLSSTSITVTSESFVYAQGTSPVFYYDDIRVTCKGGGKGFFASKPSPYEADKRD